MRILKAIIKVLQGAIINWFDKKKIECLSIETKDIEKTEILKLKTTVNK